MAARLVAALAAVAVVLGEHSSHVSSSQGGSQAVFLQRTPVEYSQGPAEHRAVPDHFSRQGPTNGQQSTGPSYRQQSSGSSRQQSSGPTYGPQTGRPSYRQQPTGPSYRQQSTGSSRQQSTGPIYRPQTTRPTYRQQPTYSSRPTYQPTTPAYGVQPHAPDSSYGSDEPACAATSGKPWCLEDKDYPTYEIQAAAEQNQDKLLSLYADVADLNTELSVDLSSYQKHETYLCPSETAYVRPLRAINTEGKWRVIVNGVKVHYETLTQTTRIEECLNEGYACPLVPECYESKCLQKSIYHRFLVYDPYDQYFPFAVETFKLPASCACLLGASTLDH